MRDIFSETRDHFGPNDKKTVEAASSLSFVMIENGECTECTQFLKDFGLLDLAMHFYGADGNDMLFLRTLQARALFKDENASSDDLRQAVGILEEVFRTSSRVLGAGHPDTLEIPWCLGEAREKLALAEQPVAERTRHSRAEP